MDSTEEEMMPATTGIMIWAGRVVSEMLIADTAPGMAAKTHTEMHTVLVSAEDTIRLSGNMPAIVVGKRKRLTEINGM